MIILNLFGGVLTPPCTGPKYEEEKKRVQSVAVNRGKASAWRFMMCDIIIDLVRLAHSFQHIMVGKRRRRDVLSRYCFVYAHVGIYFVFGLVCNAKQVTYY